MPASMPSPHAGGAAVAAAPDPSRPVPQPASWPQRYPPLVLTLLLTIWLWRHPWDGIWHDNTLYAAQALHWLHPEVFGRDLFFLYGSQASYTLFTPVYAAAVTALGLYGGTVALLLCAEVAWIAAAALLLRCLFSGRSFWLGMVVLFSLPSDYGPVPDLFSLAEPFLTPRPFAEALSMLALASILRGRLLVAALAVLAACALHPLIGLACAAALLCYAGCAHPKHGALLLAAGIGVVVTGVWLSVPPFNNIMRQMDAAWYARVVDAAYLVAWDAWRGAEWGSRTVLAFSVALTGTLVAERRWRRMLYCIVATGVLGLTATWLGGGLYRNVLVMQLQPWRALGLVQLAALCVLPSLCAYCWPRGGPFRLVLLALLLAYLIRDSAGALVAVLAGVALWHLRRQAKPVALPPRLLPVIAATMCLAALVAWWTTLQHTVSNWMWSAPTPFLPDQYPYLLGLAMLKKGGGAMMALVLFCVLSGNGWLRSRLVHLSAFGMLVAAMLCALLAVDHRPWDNNYRDQATVADIRARFLPLIAPSAIVYWEDDVQTTWFVLERASYAAYTQLVGLVFNRGTAIEGYRRLERLQALGAPDSVAGLDPQLRHDRISRLPKASFAGLVHVCGDPLLDFVVLSERFSDGVIQHATDARNQKDFYLYRCALLRGRYVDTL